MPGPITANKQSQKMFILKSLPSIGSAMTIPKCEQVSEHLTNKISLCAHVLQTEEQIAFSVAKLVAERFGSCLD